MWKGGSEQQLMTPDPGDSGDEFQIVQICCLLRYLVTRVTLRRDVFLTFSWTSRLKHLLLRVCVGGCPARNALRRSCFRWEGYEKLKKKHRAIAPAALGGCGGLGGSG